ncbi:hypothetical protein SCHIN_v1c06690 [Spiroplasma chinense]|uniref:Uncharacterized protein n=1 Tax=Spiroplasma chinense TaxID=216932 RepID=A0A5B9Y581_9MOLU|nr:hypothetical protein [Spiroplasma chinense]QEH61866.1 hypothetical protein SCHIN_v1c06690 [Spiroplasma chinense]
MDLKNKINLNKIILELFKSDSQALLAWDEIDINDEIRDEILGLAKTNNLKVIFEGLSNLLEKNLSDDAFDFSLMLTLFLQRYNYFYRTEVEWEKYCYEVGEVDFKDPGTFFLDYISIFFERQIILYTNSYLEIINDSKLKEWNKVFYERIVELNEEILETKDFQVKLSKTEQLVRFLQDTKNIYSSLEGVGVESEKQEFLAHSNEVKIVFQSMNHLINQILILVLAPTN